MLCGAPLCPAGHLPRKGGDRPSAASRQFCNAEDWRKPSGRPISPLAGEMSGRTEGGVKERRRLPPYRAATLRKSVGDIPASLRKDLLKALSEPKPESMATLMTLTSSFISSAWA